MCYRYVISFAFPSSFSFTTYDLTVFRGEIVRLPLPENQGLACLRLRYFSTIAMRKLRLANTV
jgi:hypothetical protein